MEGEHPEFDSILCLVGLLYFLVIIILHLGKSSRFSSSKPRNTHSKGKPETFSGLVRDLAEERKHGCEGV